MSPLATLTQPAYEIREGLTGTKDQPQACIEGVVGGQVVVTAIESLVKGFDGAPQWLLVTFIDIAAAVLVNHPRSARLEDETTARDWVHFVTALYARAFANADDDYDVLCDVTELSSTAVSVR